MAIEIEWRFLVTRMGEIPRGTRSARVSQTYLTTGAPVVRVRVIGEKGKITIKGAAVGSGSGPAAREEYEFDVPVADARAMLAMTPWRVEKTRYYLEGGIELDVFEGRHTGLVIAEVEVEEAGEAPSPPPGWEWRDISQDGRYSNQALAVEGLPEGHGQKKAREQR